MTQKLIDTDSGQYIVVEENQVMDSTFTHSFDPSSLPRTYAYNGDNTYSSVTVGPTKDGYYFTKTFAYINGKVSSASAWVKQ